MEILQIPHFCYNSEQPFDCTTQGIQILLLRGRHVEWNTTKPGTTIA